MKRSPKLELVSNYKGVLSVKFSFLIFLVEEKEGSDDSSDEGDQEDEAQHNGKLIENMIFISFYLIAKF